MSYPKPLLQAKMFFPCCYESHQGRPGRDSYRLHCGTLVQHSVKTWLCAPMSNNRLDALCMTCVPRARAMKHKEDFITRLIAQFAQIDPGHLQLLSPKHRWQLHDGKHCVA